MGIKNISIREFDTLTYEVVVSYTDDNGGAKAIARRFPKTEMLENVVYAMTKYYNKEINK